MKRRRLSEVELAFLIDNCPPGHAVGATFGGSVTLTVTEGNRWAHDLLDLRAASLVFT